MDFDDKKDAAEKRRRQEINARVLRETGHNPAPIQLRIKPAPEMGKVLQFPVPPKTEETA
jgi:hypothetical protein